MKKSEFYKYNNGSNFIDDIVRDEQYKKLSNKEKVNMNLYNFEAEIHNKLFFISEDYDLDIRAYFDNENMYNTYENVEFRVDFNNKYCRYCLNIKTDLYHVGMMDFDIQALLGKYISEIVDAIINEYYYVKYFSHLEENKYISLPKEVILKFKDNYESISFLKTPKEDGIFFDFIDYKHALSFNDYIMFNTYTSSNVFKSFKELISLSMYLCEYADYQGKIEPFGRYSEIFLELVYKVINLSNTDIQDLNDLYDMKYAI